MKKILYIAGVIACVVAVGMYLENWRSETNAAFADLPNS